MSQKAGSTIRFDDDIDKAVRVKAAEERTNLTRVINGFLREWVQGNTVPRNTNAVSDEAVLTSLLHIRSDARKIADKLDSLIARLRPGGPIDGRTDSLDETDGIDSGDTIEDLERRVAEIARRAGISDPATEGNPRKNRRAK